MSGIGHMPSPLGARSLAPPAPLVHQEPLQQKEAPLAPSKSAIAVQKLGVTLITSHDEGQVDHDHALAALAQLAENRGRGNLVDRMFGDAPIHVQDQAAMREIVRDIKLNADDEHVVLNSTTLSDKAMAEMMARGADVGHPAELAEPVVAMHVEEEAPIVEQEVAPLAAMPVGEPEAQVVANEEAPVAPIVMHVSEPETPAVQQEAPAEKPAPISVADLMAQESARTLESEQNQPISPPNQSASELAPKENLDEKQNSDLNAKMKELDNNRQEWREYEQTRADPQQAMKTESGAVLSPKGTYIPRPFFR